MKPVSLAIQNDRDGEENEVWNNWDSKCNIFNPEAKDSEFPKTYVNVVKGKLDPLFLQTMEILISVKVKELF